MMAGPWWLVRKAKIVEARRTLRKMVSRNVDVEPTLAMIIKTDRTEQEMESGSTYRDLFTKVNRRRTEICTGVYTVQVFTGIYLIGYGVYFFQRKFYIQSPAFICCRVLSKRQRLVYL
jgi:MFS transporter, SP family, general alpha glucoside:H+ symporter